MRGIAIAALLACTFHAGVPAAQAQDIEPRAYSNAPVGVNFLVAGYARTQGSLSTDTAVPLTNTDLRTSNAVLAYVRVLDLWGKSAKVDMVMPYTWLSGTADFAGEPIERVVDGRANPSFRLAINLYGAPALTLKEFAGFKPDLIVGASLRVSAPWSQYDETRLVNIGTNRWSVTSEVGASKTRGRWTWEMAAAATVFTDNDEFQVDRTRSQDPLYSLQGHVIYGFPSGIWSAVDVNYFTGGRTSIDGEHKADLQQNWRVGLTLAVPVNARNSIKLYGSSGVSARTGNNFDLAGIAWQHRWGGGL